MLQAPAKSSGITLSTVPTQLIVGPHAAVTQHVQTFLREQLCTSESAALTCMCASCKKLAAKQHEAVVWVEPEKTYTLDDIHILFERSALGLDEQQKLFFVLAKAHTLSGATANRLLKLLEEPPAGCHFLLMTDNQDQVLPTIQSRSHVFVIHDAAAVDREHALFAFFLKPEQRADVFGLEQFLKKEHFNDVQSMQLGQQLLEVCSGQLKINLMHNGSEKERAFWLQACTVVRDALKRPPQPGSSEFFWKRLYLFFPPHW